ncbi:VOC family protein [Tsuneonella flava]|uniref:VOC family protein n=1 Tax=Tsuneonella flava TaxID=2055955 RepID=A0ABX7KCB5_9SPHN|nr:VOC family protein [Tsuneonella flava]QSB45915.1 VOC family protein [Tsuneonella flava]
MSRMIFINLPVADLERAKKFYSSIGFTNEPRFTDDTAAAMTLSETIHLVLLTPGKWEQFSNKAKTDPYRTSSAIYAVTCDSRDAVDEMLARVADAGGKPDSNPPQDFEFMYSRSFEDPEGYDWEMVWMDPATAELGSQEFNDLGGTYSGEEGVK